jgi:hypothetical protein
MRKCTIAICFPALLVVLTCASQAQSLGDVAREQRQKQQTKDAHAPHKVVTNEEIPESPDASTDSSSEGGTTPESSEPASSAGNKTAEQWKSEIQARKARISALQSQVEKLNNSDHFVEANRYYNGVQYNQHQLKKQQEAQRMQKQLDSEKAALSNAQDSARKAGFGTAVYDPEN